MQEKVNYITHLNCVFGTIVHDERLSPFHVSLYFSLFQYWNISKFRNPISINREEIMLSSKIGSANTYTKCLKELNEWGYIKYLPSHSPLIGSKIYLYTFNKTPAKSTDNTTYNGIAKTPDNAMRPSINSLNKTNKQNNENEHEHKRRKNNRKSFAATGNRSEKEKNSAKKEKRPSLQEIKNYFTGWKWPEVEAEKFYNYFESNGWLVGGKTPMKNWKAATRNWMINAEKFSNGKTKLQAGKLHATGNKDYSEPL